MNHENIKVNQSNADSDIQSGLTPELVKNDSEILQSEKAKSILPYLTLDKLDKREVSNLLKLSNDVIYAIDAGWMPEDRFSANDDLSDAIAEVSGEEESWEKGWITPKLGQARKIVCASLIDEMSRANIDKMEAIHEAFFSITDNISSHCDGLRGSLELIAMAERGIDLPCLHELYDEIVYDYSFGGEGNDFEKVLCSSSPITQLRLLAIYNRTVFACLDESFGDVALDKIDQALSTVENDKHTKPLIKIMASTIHDVIIKEANSTWVFIDEDDPEYWNKINERNERLSIQNREQEEFREEFPAMRGTRHILKKIAPGVVGALNGSGTISDISNREGELVSLFDCSDDNTFGLNKDLALMLSAAHNNEVEKKISEQIGLNLCDIPLNSQIQLLKFMTEAGPARFDRLCDVLSKVDKKMRLKLTESFVAAGFGDDYGEALLSMVGSERCLNMDEKERILDTINSCRESIDKITALYADFDGGKFAEEYRRASNERLTDAVMAFQHIARAGAVKADLGWAGESRFNYNEAIESLEYEAKSLSIISGTLTDVKNGKDGAFAEVVMHSEPSIQRLNRTMYNFYSPDYGYVLLYTRPEGSHSFDPMVDYGKIRSRYITDGANAGTEASISLVTNPVDPFSLPSPFKPNPVAVRNPRFYDPATMDKVSAIRLDREGRTPGMAADDISRDPLNSAGMVSVDLAAIGDRADTPSGKIARLLSVGGKWREMKSGVSSSLNHNTRWFDHDTYGSAKGFKVLVDYVDELAWKWCKESRPGEEAESFTKLSKKNRGSKVRRAV